jgi:hypothetical protein
MEQPEEPTNPDGPSIPATEPVVQPGGEQPPEPEGGTGITPDEANRQAGADEGQASEA